MEVVFLNNKEEAHSSLAVIMKDSTFAIDCPPSFIKKLERENINDVDFILFSSSDKSSVGGVSTLFEKLGRNKIVAFMSKETEEKLSQKYDIENLDIKLFQDDVPFEVNNMRIHPFKVGNRYGFNFLGMTFSPMSKELTTNNFKDSKVLLFDNVSWFQEGDNTIADALQFLKNVSPNQSVFLQQGTLDHTREFEMNQYWEQIKGTKEISLSLGYDGTRLFFNDYISQVLSESREGIQLRPPHAGMVATGMKTMIIDDRLYKNTNGKFFYFMENGLCLGILRLKMPDKLTLEQFKEMEEKHRINNSEREKWWGNKEVLYGYNFDVVEIFETPQLVLSDKDNPDTFIKDFKLLDNQSLLQNPTEYNSAKSLDVAQDWNIVASLFSMLNNGGKTQYSNDVLVNLAKQIYDEALIRNLAFSKKMPSFSKLLYDKVSKGDQFTLESINKFQDITLIKDFIALSGRPKKREFIQLFEPYSPIQ